jgi:type VI secretion system protein ImpI
MPLTFAIENQTNLPDGGPLSVTVSGKRGLDIGRDQHLDWTLPDPTRTISGKHCEIRFHDGAYWLHDVSTNGTFINGSEHRVQGPHRLRNGDRIEIGHYIISATIEGEEGITPQSTPEAQRFATRDSPALWNARDDAAPPAPRRDFQPRREARPVHPDPLDWLVDAPGPSSTPRPMPPKDPPRFDPRSDDFAWASRPMPRPGQVAPEMPVPTPRRPMTQAPPRPTPWDDTSPFETVPPRPSDPEATGIPEDVIAWRDPGDLAELLGALMRLVAADLKQLLAARAASKRLARSTDQTMVQALDNNPLKFSPTAEDALRLMFGRSTTGYLDARQALEQTFKDLKVHQVKTYAAMQHALRLLVEDLDPQTIDEATAADTGLGALLTSRKARLWESYVARWNAKTAPHEDGLVDAFMLYFAECYDKDGQKGR